MKTNKHILKSETDPLKVKGFAAIVEQYPAFLGSDVHESVRVSLNLSPEAISAKEWLAEKWGCTQKDVVYMACPYTMVFSDLMTEWTHIVVEKARNPPGSDEEFNQEVAAEALKMLTPTETVRKTHVLGKGAVALLEKQAAKRDQTKDELLHQVLLMLKVREEKANQLLSEKYEQAEEIIQAAEKALEPLFEQMGELFEKEGSLWDSFSDLKYWLENLRHAMYDDQGRPNLTINV